MKQEDGMGKRITTIIMALFVGGILYVKIKFNLWLPPKLIFIAALVTPQIVALFAIICLVICRFFQKEPS